jgi:hypothetical protein
MTEIRRSRRAGPVARASGGNRNALASFLKHLLASESARRLLLRLSATLDPSRFREFQKIVSENAGLRRRVRLLETALTDYSHRFGLTPSAHVAFALDEKPRPPSHLDAACRVTTSHPLKLGLERRVSDSSLKATQQVDHFGRSEQEP